MRKFFLTATAASLIATASLAGQLGSGGVSSIKDNGRINGDQSWTITCNSGYGVVRRHGDAWANNSGNTYSNRLWSLSLKDFAAKMCE
jgi:hypothetical protein